MTQHTPFFLFNQQMYLNQNIISPVKPEISLHYLLLYFFFKEMENIFAVNY